MAKVKQQIPNPSDLNTLLESIEQIEVTINNLISGLSGILNDLDQLDVKRVRKTKRNFNAFKKEFTGILVGFLDVAELAQEICTKNPTIIDEDGKKVVVSGTVVDAIQNFTNMLKDVIGKFKSMALDLTIIGLLAPTIAISFVGFNIFILVIKNLAKSCAELGQIEIPKEAAETVSSLNKIIKELAGISLSASLLGLLIVPATMGLLGSLLLIGTLKLITQTIVSGFNSKAIKETKESFKNLKSVFTDMILTVAIMSLTGVLIMRAFPFIIKGLLGFAGIVLMLTLLGKLMDLLRVQLKNTYKSIEEIGKICLIISGLVVTMTLLGLLVLKAWDLLVWGFIAITVMIGYVIGIMTLVGSDLFKKQIQKGTAAILTMTIAFTLLAATIAILVLDGMLLQKHWDVALFGLLGMTILLGLTIGIMFILNAMKSQILQGAIIMAIIAASMLVISVSLVVMAAAGLIWQKVDPLVALGMIGFIAAFAGMAALLGAFPIAIVGAATLLILAGSMIVLSVAMIILSAAIMAFGKTKTESRVEFVGFVYDLVKLVTIIGLASPFILMGSVALSVLSISILLLGTAMFSLQHVINSTPSKEELNNLKNSITEIVETLSIFGNPKILLKIAKSTPGIILFTASMSFLSKAIVGMADIADSYKILDKSPIREKDFQYKVLDPIMSIVDDMSTVNLKDISKAGLKMYALSSLITNPVQDMIGVIKDLINMTVKEYDSKGNVKKVRQVTEEDFKLAEAGIISIINSLGNAISGDGVVDALNKAEDLSKKALERLNLLVDPVVGMVESARGIVDVIQKDAKYFKADEHGISSFSKDLISIVGAYALLTVNDGPLNEKNLKVISGRDFSRAMDEDHLGSLIRISQELGGDKLDVKKQTDATKNIISLIEKTNTIDTSKVKSVTDMFREMKGFSESINGNFEKLADVLNEKLIDSLEKLNTTLSDGVTAEVNVSNSNKTIKEPAIPLGSTQKEAKELSRPIQDYKNDLAEIIRQARAAVSVLEDISKNTSNRLY